MAHRYHELLKGTPLQLPLEASFAESAYHLYVVRHPRRDELKAYLDAAGEVGGPELGAAWVNKTFQAKVKKLSAEEQDKLTVHKAKCKSCGYVQREMV